MPTVHANGIDIWYQIIGPDPSVAQGPSPERLPLVLTHGFAGPSAQWQPEVLPLAEKRPLVLRDARPSPQPPMNASSGASVLSTIAQEVIPAFA